MIRLGYDAFAAARSQVRDAADELAESQSAIGRQVAGLMDGGWSGAAADAFDDAWHDWLAGAARVREALARIGSALASAERDLTARDEEADILLSALRQEVGR